jgi:hypothetical protein
LPRGKVDAQMRARLFQERMEAPRRKVRADPRELERVTEK